MLKVFISFTVVDNFSNNKKGYIRDGTDITETYLVSSETRFC